METKETCRCLCGCTEPATGTDDQGELVCDECRSYWLRPDGDVVCARQCGGGDTCPDCHESINWGGILTGDPGSGQSNWREGSCGCPGREWTHRESGSWNNLDLSYTDQADRDFAAEEE